MALANRNMANSVPNVWQAATKLTSCRQLLAQYCGDYAQSCGAVFEIDDRKFTQAFFAWAQILEESEPHLRQDAADYFQFAVGALLAELLRADAIRVTTAAAAADATDRDPREVVARWWPTGFALTRICIELLRKICAQECSKMVAPSERIADIKVWQSFRENLLEEPSIAIAYFDDFMGVTPNWRNPGYAGHRAAARH